MPSAVDIITYIGVPLAGVMPVLFTFVKAFLTKSRVRRELKKNNLTATTRTSLMSGLCEVEHKRYNIEPLVRESAEYWIKPAKSSGLEGGTWTLFCWQTIVCGRVKSTISLHDTIRQPQAEVEFDKLVTFLLDRGAMPDADGVRMLKTMGLQTPRGTPVLVDGQGTARRGILVVASPDESEGHLSLKLYWSDAMASRGINDLPPYWTRLSPPNRTVEVLSEKDKGSAAESVTGDTKAEGEVLDADVKLKSPDLDQKSVEGASGEAEESPANETSNQKPVRLFVGPTGLEDARIETTSGDINSAGRFSIDHLRPSPAAGQGTINSNLWFACSAITILGRGNRGLWRYTIPPEIVTFTNRDSIPHGVLVWLNMLEEEETPMSRAREQQRRQRDIQRQQNEHQEYMQRDRHIASLPPAQQQAERAKLNQERGRKMGDRVMQERLQREQALLDKKSEALNSPRVRNSLVSSACLKYLQRPDQREKQDHGTSVPTDAQQAAEYILYTMLFDKDRAENVCGLLDLWRHWSESSGVMNDNHLDEVARKQIDFCYAGILVNIIQERATAAESWAGSDLAECQKAWRTVWVG